MYLQNFVDKWIMTEFENVQCPWLWLHELICNVYFRRLLGHFDNLPYLILLFKVYLGLLNGKHLKLVCASISNTLKCYATRIFPVLQSQPLLRKGCGLSAYVNYSDSSHAGAGRSASWRWKDCKSWERQNLERSSKERRQSGRSSHWNGQPADCISPPSTCGLRLLA